MLQTQLDDPVVATDGFTYSKAAIAAWFAAGLNTSPVTGQPLTSHRLIENLTLRNFLNMDKLEN